MRYVSAALGNDMELAERFITLFLARLDVTMRHMTYVDAGHGYAFIYDRAGNVKRLLPRGLPFGVFQNESYQQGEYVFQPGEALVLFSDGLADACPGVLLGRAPSKEFAPRSSIDWRARPVPTIWLIALPKLRKKVNSSMI